MKILANDMSTSSRRVTPSRVRTMGVILLIAAAAYHFATTGKPYDIMFASCTGSEEHMVFGCDSTKQGRWVLRLSNSKTV